jgi:hypothetical protein
MPRPVLVAIWGAGTALLAVVALTWRVNPDEALQL